MKSTTWITLAACVIGLGVWVSAARGGPHGDSGCSTCHVPHMALPQSSPNSAGPLWCPSVGSGTLATFAVYTSPTFDALNTGITQPDGSSRLCLGCHDGSYAGVAAEHTFGSGKGMTLTESHPISFRYDTSLAYSLKLRSPGSLRDPITTPSGVTSTGTIATDLLDSNGKMQCGSCHDVHHAGIGPHYLRFAYESDNGRTMCRTCHNK